jgi:hypothetical protein
VNRKRVPLVVGALMLAGLAWLGAERVTVATPDPCARVPREDSGPQADTGVIVVGGPTVVGFFPAVTGPASDSTVSRIESEYSHQFARADSMLSVRGVAVHWRFVTDVRLAGPHGEHPTTLALDSQPWGYVLATPCREPQVLYGVRSDSEVVTAVGGYLDRSSPVAQPGREKLEIRRKR